MSIDWIKLEEKPDTKVKIEGHLLLNLRSKINDMEGKIFTQNQEFEQKIDELNELKSINSELEQKISNSESKINEMESQLEKLSKTSTNLEQAIIGKDNEIKKYKNDLENIAGNHKKDTEHLRKEIESLNNKLYEKVKELNNINKEIDVLRSQSLKAKRLSNILRKLKEAMTIKGYITDKELELIERETEQQVPLI